MPTELHRAEDRGHFNHGWLDTAHSFSFADYHNPDRMNFGRLLVLNEDTIQGGSGFGEHFHHDMEIVTIPLSGALRHGDSMGNGSVIRSGDIQIMSAGTGIMHSEFNASSSEPVHLLQIWIIPKTLNLPIRYDEHHFEPSVFQNQFVTIVAPTASPDHLQIHQDATFRLGHFDAGSTIELPIENSSHGLFVFVISGSIDIIGKQLNQSDAIAIHDEKNLRATTHVDSHILTIEVPM